LSKKCWNWRAPKASTSAREVSKADAIKYFTEKGDEYKLELIDGLEDGQITFYQQGNFTDLCKGPHIPSTETSKPSKSSTSPALTGAAIKAQATDPRLRHHVPETKGTGRIPVMLEEAKKRDHRKLGAGIGTVHVLRKSRSGLAALVAQRHGLAPAPGRFLKKEQIKRGYQPVITPHIGSKKLYVTSGHWEKYGEDSFQPILTPQEGREFLLKPMNCPHHCEIYGYRPRSYRELPVRIAEFGTVYRYEMSGELHGLTRVRGFTQDDAHIFCTEDQLKEEFLGVLDLTRFVLAKLGFDKFTAQISLRDPENKTKYIGYGRKLGKSRTSHH
jgi:threonyl-tRNA synthetase